MNNVRYLLLGWAYCGILGGAGYGMTVWAKDPMLFAARFGWRWVVFYALLGLPVGLVGGAVFLAIGKLFSKRAVPIVQYDEPQEGVWPPPPVVPADTKRGKT